jgi:hypothetical protein
MPGSEAETQRSSYNKNVVVEKTEMSPSICSPKSVSVPVLPALEPAALMQAPSPPPVPPHEPPGLTDLAQCPGRMDGVSSRNGDTEGSYSLEPVAAHRHHLSGIKLDERLHWKPPNVEEKRRRAFDVINVKHNETSAGRLLVAETVPTLCI